ncbi:hypothetical protein F5X68DRAFT_178265 [Plectosphaerella plurivora]|uniref:Uncharacterized protein n=1 Tax=Plectosphaerella plurivora TaxID=936078 RepID=A0A9P8V0F2_9PEZI|nr:hypothetical protein F5X68DRAFT_178265 [Plectosphaerella plurivora]
MFNSSSGIDTTTAAKMQDKKPKKKEPETFAVKFRTLLRSSGFGIATYRDEPEKPKILIEESRKTALARTIVHVLPSAVSLSIITLNLIGYFIGDQLQGMRGQDRLKFGLVLMSSKIQELLIVASLTMVVMHCLRHELIFGDGLPLGFIVSPWSFSSVSYFWSANFWGAVRSRETTDNLRTRRFLFALLLVTAGVIAVIGAPAAATLMTPRIVEFPAGGGIFWLNSSPAHLWPTTLNASYYDGADCSTDQLRMWNTECPSAGFTSLFSHVSTWASADGASEYSIEVQDANIRKEIRVWPTLWNGDDAWSVSAHAASGTLQDAMRQFHVDSMADLGGRHKQPNVPPYPYNLYFSVGKQYKLKTKLPASRVMCSYHGTVDLSTGKLLARIALLPEKQRVGRLPSFFNQDGKLVGNWLNDTSTIDHLALFGGVRRVVAVPVPIGENGDQDSSATSLGLVILHDTSDDENPETVDMTACAIDARWINGSSVITSVGYRFFDHKIHSNTVANRLEVEPPKLDEPINRDLGPIAVKERDNGPPTLIKLSKSWYDAFSPILSIGIGFTSYEATILSEGDDQEQTGNRTQTALESILQSNWAQGFKIRNGEIQNIISSAVVDGLSRSGLVQNRESYKFITPFVPDGETRRTKMVRRGPPKESFPEPVELVNSPVGSTRFVMSAIYNGYGLVIEGWFEAMCVAVLLVHVCLALGHTAWVLSQPKTSGAWGNIVELVALAIRSPPPGEKVLENTGAGVDSFHSVGAVAWVETEKPTASATGADQPGQQLRLRFKDGQIARDPNLVPKVNAAYDWTAKEEEQSLAGDREGADDEKTVGTPTVTGVSSSSSS